MWPPLAAFLTGVLSIAAGLAVSYGTGTPLWLFLTVCAAFAAGVLAAMSSVPTFAGPLLQMATPGAGGETISARPTELPVLETGLEEQQSLADIETHFRAMADEFPAMVWIVHRYGATLFQNRRVQAYTGRRFLRDPAARLDVIHPDDRDVVRAHRDYSRADAPEYQIEVRFRRHDGAYRWHHLAAAPIRLPNDRSYWIVSAIDIEDLKRAQVLQKELNGVLEARVAEATRQLREETAVRERAQRQLLQNQKMEAIGRLTSGIAHDLNNKLMVINANIDAVARQLKDQPRLTRRLLAALVAADQSSALMSKLLSFAPQRDLRPQYTDVAEQLSSTTELLERSLLSDAVKVRLSIPEELWPVEVDPHQLETAIVNLAVNARDAMPNGGDIDIEARNIRVRAGHLLDPTLAGDFVQIVVRDTGTGIPPDHLERVFEPFFTTKEGSKGSGLGLSQVHGFASQLGGSVELDSTLGTGTSVALYLPKAELPARLRSKPVEEQLSEEEEVALPPSVADVLIIDDEPEVAYALQGMIEELGHTVRIALGADEAHEAVRLRKPNLVLSDVAMPGNDGVALGREIRRRAPSVRVVLITGNPVMAPEASEFALLKKPITSRALDAAIKRELAASNGSTVVSLFPSKPRKAT